MLMYGQANVSLSISMCIPTGRESLGPKCQWPEGIQVGGKRRAKAGRQMRVSKDTDAEKQKGWGDGQKPGSEHPRANFLATSEYEGHREMISPCGTRMVKDLEN